MNRASPLPSFPEWPLKGMLRIVIHSAEQTSAWDALRVPCTSVENTGTFWWVFFRAVTFCVASAPSLFPQQRGVTAANKAGSDLFLQQVAHEEAEAVPLLYLHCYLLLLDK